MISWAAILSSTKRDRLARVAVAAVDDRAAVVAAAVATAAVAEDGRVAVVAVAVVAEAGTVTEATAVAAETAAGKRFKQSSSLIITGELRCSPVLFCERHLISRPRLADVFLRDIMAILHVKNIPRDLYAALRRRAKSNQRSIAAEVRALLKEYIPTAREIRARRRFVKDILRLRAKLPKSTGPFQSAEGMIREDRER